MVSPDIETQHDEFEALVSQWKHDIRSARTRRSSHPDGYVLDEQTGLYDKEQAWVDHVQSVVTGYMTSEDAKRVSRAMWMAIWTHRSVYRDSGDPYTEHVFAVAIPLCTEKRMDATTIASALLHDVIEDTKDQSQQDAYKTISTHIGTAVADTIQMLTKFKGRYVRKQMRQEMTYLQIIQALLDNPRVGIIKIFDVRHNLRTLASKQKYQSRIKKIFETQDIYVPLARLLGMKYEAEELETMAIMHMGDTERETAIRVMGRIDTFLANVSTDEVKSSFRLVASPYGIRDIDAWVTSVGSAFLDDGQMHMNVDIALASDPVDHWGQRAQQLSFAFLWSGEYAMEAPVGIHEFQREVAEKITDSYEFWLTRTSDGTRFQVRVFDHEAFEKEKASILSLYQPEERISSMERVALAEKKLEQLQSRLTHILSKLEHGEVLSKQIIQELMPRRPKDRMYVVGHSEHGAEDVWTVPVGSTVLDYTKSFAPHNWPRAAVFYVNGDKVGYSHVLQPYDVVAVVFGKVSHWHPEMIRAFHTDAEGAVRVQDKILQVLRGYKDKKDGRYPLLVNLILKEGKRVIEEYLPSEDRPLMVRLDRVLPIIESYYAGRTTHHTSTSDATIIEHILFDIGMGFADVETVNQLASGLQEANRNIGIFTLMFENDREGIMRDAAHLATSLGISYTHVEAETIGGSVVEVQFYVDPDNVADARVLASKLSYDKTLLTTHGITGVSVKKRFDTIRFSRPRAQKSDKRRHTIRIRKR